MVGSGSGWGRRAVDFALKPDYSSRAARQSFVLRAWSGTFFGLALVMLVFVRRAWIYLPIGGCWLAGAHAELRAARTLPPPAEEMPLLRPHPAEVDYRTTVLVGLALFTTVAAGWLDRSGLAPWLFPAGE